MLLVTLFNTGAVWGVTSDAGVTGPGVTPFLAAAVVDRGGAAAAPSDAAMLPQPEGAAPLPAGGLPAGFWSGRVSRLLVARAAAPAHGRLPAAA